MLRRKHHHAHDALPVHVEIVLHDRDLTPELRGAFDDLRRGPGVQPILVLDLNDTFGH
jgi:hypothetical protein